MARQNLFFVAVVLMVVVVAVALVILFLSPISKAAPTVSGPVSLRRGFNVQDALKQ